MRHLFALALLSLAPVAAAANAPDAGVALYTASTTGQLTIDAEGRVVDVQLDKKELGDQIMGSVAAQIGQWRFEPVLEDGRPVRAVGHLQLGLLAIRRDGEPGQRVGMHRVNFVNPPGVADDGVGPRLTHTRAPRYPASALRVGLGASVQLLLRFDADGRVADAAARSVWLLGPAPAGEGASRRAADEFAEAALAAARKWRASGAADATLVVPVQFQPQGWGNRWVPTEVVAMALPEWAQAADPAEPQADGRATDTRLRPVGALGTIDPEAAAGGG